MTNKFSNFKPFTSRFAEIDVTTGMWWWKHVETVMIEKQRFRGGTDWFFTVSGHWCPPEVRECEREYYRGKA